MRIPKTVTNAPTAASGPTQRRTSSTVVAEPRGPRSNRTKIATRTAVGIARTTNQTGRVHHQAAVPTPGSVTPRSRAVSSVMSTAVRCQRNAVMANVPAVTTSFQTRGRCSTRFIGSRTRTATPMMARPYAMRATVGGAMLEISSPGSPTMLVG